MTKAPIVVIEPSKYNEVPRGQPFTLTARAEGLPEPRVVWRRRDGQPLNAEVQQYHYCKDFTRNLKIFYCRIEATEFCISLAFETLIVENMRSLPLTVQEAHQILPPLSQVRFLKKLICNTYWWCRISVGIYVYIIPKVGDREVDAGTPLTSIPSGGKVELLCVAEGSPKPRIEWTWDIGPARGDKPAGYVAPRWVASSLFLGMRRRIEHKV